MFELHVTSRSVLYVVRPFSDYVVLSVLNA